MTYEELLRLLAESVMTEEPNGAWDETIVTFVFTNDEWEPLRDMLIQALPEPDLTS